MHVFIWKRIEALTSNYHPEGGLVIVAKDLRRARKMAEEAAKGDRSPLVAHAADAEPDLRYAVNDTADEQLIVFPDAGCC
jgi:hypothetical protein